MLVTLFSDASWCPKQKVGGWGAWVKSKRVDRGAQYGGPFSRNDIPTSNAAETMAACCALWMALRDGIACKKDVILFQIDNQHTLRSLMQEWNKNVSPGPEQEAYEQIHALRCEHELTFRHRHVKAHQRPVNTRFGVNGLCDRRAKLHMREAREIFAFTPASTQAQ